MVIGAFFSIQFSYTAGNDTGNEFRPCPNSQNYWVVYLLLHSEHMSKVQANLRNWVATQYICLHIRSFLGRWCPLHTRILDNVENPENLECTCIFIFVSTFVFYPMRCARFSWDLCDSIERDRVILRRNHRMSVSHACILATTAVEYAVHT